MRFVEHSGAGRRAAHFLLSRAERFARHLRQLQVSPNGHPNIG